MAAKKGKAGGYKGLHQDLKTMDVKAAVAAIKTEVRGARRADMTQRLVGKLNREEGRRRMRDVLALLAKKTVTEAEVHAALFRNN